MANNLNINFSKVQHVDIAPMVGLDPNVKGDDILSFDMFRARLPNAGKLDSFEDPDDRDSVCSSPYAVQAGW